MTISSVGSTELIQPEGAVGKQELDRGDFMSLFITQLQYQDPMKPMDSYEMASQLAQFSNMDATMQMSDNMEKLLDYQTSQNNLQLLTLLGTEVQISGNRMGVVDGKATSTEFVLNDVAESCVIEIYDDADHLIWQENKGSLSSGTYELDWNGKDLLDEVVDDGAYSYVVKAVDMGGREVDVDYSSTGTVTGIDFDSGAALLTMDEYVQAGVDQVVKVQEKK
jgi:flagellar basal-body rod modification protein FlgD